jgi:hypothetical protein
MFWATDDVLTWRDAFVISGSSLFTLGFQHPGTLIPIALSFAEAGIGLLLLAILITYLPSLYQAFSRREAGVSKLEARSRTNSGVGVIRLSWVVGRLEGLQELWGQWEDWFQDVDESHTTFPTLVFFRSPHPDVSWITSAGAILDAASLYASCVDVPRVPEPEFMIRAGYICLRHIAGFFGIAFDPDPTPSDPVSVTREEFDEAIATLGDAGVPLKGDREQMWRDFAGWRVNYDAVLVGLCRLTMAPQAAWSSDRYPDGHYVPAAFPWLRRRSRPSP